MNSVYWGIAVWMGVTVSGIVGKGHINPAVTLAMFIRQRIDFKRFLVYSVMQYIGAFIASAIIFGVYYDKLIEANNGSARFDMGHLSQIFSTYPSVGHITCLFDQVLGTGVLLFGIMAITDPNNFQIPQWAQPFCIGSVVSSIIAAYALNCGASINPARDLGPRILLLIGGWGKEAFSANSYYFFIPVVGPYVGAVVGMVIYEIVIGAQLLQPEPSAHQVEDFSTLETTAIQSKL